MNNKLDELDKRQSSGVYELNCNNCYIVQTFFTRFEENTYLRNKEAGDEGLSSSFVNHLLNTGHDRGISNFSVLHMEQVRHKLDALEILGK